MAGRQGGGRPLGWRWRARLQSAARPVALPPCTAGMPSSNPLLHRRRLPPQFHTPCAPLGASATARAGCIAGGMGLPLGALPREHPPTHSRWLVPVAAPVGRILATWSTPMRSASEVCKKMRAGCTGGRQAGCEESEMRNGGRARTCVGPALLHSILPLFPKTLLNALASAGVCPPSSTQQRRSGTNVGCAWCRDHRTSTVYLACTKMKDGTPSSTCSSASRRGRSGRGVSWQAAHAGLHHAACWMPSTCPAARVASPLPACLRLSTP